MEILTLGDLLYYNIIMKSILYLENPHTGEILKLKKIALSNRDWLWERGVAGCYLHEFERDSPDHTLFLLKNSDRILK
jgi:hypothetical protein